jgi:hypothetical protein
MFIDTWNTDIVIWIEVRRWSNTAEQHNTFWFKFGRLEHRGEKHSDWKSVPPDSMFPACTPDFEFQLVISTLYSKTQDKDKIKIQREFTSSTLPGGSLWLWILGRCLLPGVSSPGGNVTQQGEVRSRRLEERRIMLSGTLNLQFTLSVSASVLSGFSILGKQRKS